MHGQDLCSKREPLETLHISVLHILIPGEMLSPSQTEFFLFPYCDTEKLSCKVAVELLPTQTSKSEGSTTQPSFAALQ
jgi:hypothetical protein